jgi:hypothetical protein
MAAGDGLDKLRRARAALLPLAELGRLADLRTRPAMRVVLAQRSAWVTWPAEAADLAMRMLAVPAAQLYEPRGDHWHALGHALPDFAVPPPGEAIPLAQGIVPAPLVAVRPTDTPDPPGQVRLVRSQQPRAARLLCVALAAVQQWLDHEPITAEELSRLHACRVESMLWVAARHSALPLIEGGAAILGRNRLRPAGLSNRAGLARGDLAASTGHRRGRVVDRHRGGVSDSAGVRFRPARTLRRGPTVGQPVQHRRRINRKRLRLQIVIACLSSLNKTKGTNQPG